VELDPHASEAEKKAARAGRTYHAFTIHYEVYKKKEPFIYKQKPFEVHEKEQLVNEIVFQTRNRNR
jgi:hypothetical protein